MKVLVACEDSQEVCNAFRNPTNADRIRSMTDEELAMLLYEVGYDEGWDKPEYALKWLQQPAEEEYNGEEKQ